MINTKVLEVHTIIFSINTIVLFSRIFIKNDQKFLRSHEITSVIAIDIYLN